MSSKTMALSKAAEHAVAQALSRVSELLRHDTTPGLRDDAEGLRAQLKQLRRTLARKLATDDSEATISLLKSLIAVADEVVDVAETSVVKPDEPPCAGAFRFVVGGRGALGAHVKSFRSRIQDIMAQLGGGGGENSSADEQGFVNDDDHLLEMDDDIFVGFEENLAILRERLMNEDDVGLRCVPIVGMSGIGKSTLAKRVSEEVKQHFDCFAWVFVSQSFDVRDLLREILAQVGFKGQQHSNILEKSSRSTREAVEEGMKGVFLNGLGSNELFKIAKNELEEKRFLVVLDDVWTVKIWNNVKHAFPQGNSMGSRIMVTTRSSKVARCVDLNGFIHQPKLLTPKESFKLFDHKARGYHRMRHSKFEDLSMCHSKFEDLFGKIEGLPLLIILLGGLLRTKRSLAEWEEVHDCLTRHLQGTETLNWSSVLGICFGDLPFYLTPCFLYFGIFPENCEVSKQKLIQHWIVEGFIRKPMRERETMESIAEGYLRELIVRGMVQVAKRDHTEVGIKACRMHDLLRNFCIWEAQKSNFFETLPSWDTYQNSALGRRVVVQNGSDLNVIQDSNPATRSFLGFSVHDLSSWRNIMKKFTLLRVLELGLMTSWHYKRRRRSKFPREIGNLIYLRYLGLRGVLISGLPSSIGNLRYLEILDLRNVGITKLPRSIGKLQSLYTLDLCGNELQSLPETMSRLTCLRHLLLPTLQSYIPASTASRSGCFRMDKLKSLRTLKFVQAGALIRFDAVLRLTNIQNLRIEFGSCQEVRAVLALPIMMLNRLRSLHMSLLPPDMFPSLESLSRCHNISKLGLHGKLSEDDLRYLPPNLSKLRLSESSMKQDPMAVLEKMCNLRFLHLGKNSYNGLEMACLKQGFPKLKTLELVGLSKLQEWRVERGSMTSLQTLDIENAHDLKMLPEELKSLPSLRDLNITEVRETSGEEPGVVDGTEGQNLNIGRQILRPAPSFSLTVPSMPPNISVHLIIAEITSAGG